MIASEFGKAHFEFHFVLLFLSKNKGSLLAKHELKVKPLGVNPTKWSNTIKLFVSNMPTNCLSVFDYFVGLALKELG